MQGMMARETLTTMVVAPILFCATIARILFAATFAVGEDIEYIPNGNEIYGYHDDETMHIYGDVDITNRNSSIGKPWHPCPTSAASSPLLACIGTLEVVIGDVETEVDPYTKFCECGFVESGVSVEELQVISQYEELCCVAYHNVTYCTLDEVFSETLFCANGGLCRNFGMEGEEHAGCLCPPHLGGDHCEYLTDGIDDEWGIITPPPAPASGSTVSPYPSASPTLPFNIKEWNALVAFYRSTGGESWLNNEGWLSPLSYCDWYGITCNENLSVSELKLAVNEMKGTLALDILQQLSNLELIDLSDNALMTRRGLLGDDLDDFEQHSGIVLFPHLMHLRLSNNQLRGPIGRLSWLPSLKELHLQGNQFTTIEIDSAPNLRVLDLDQNYLQGTLQYEVAKLESLEVLRLGSNFLSGTLLSDYSAMVNLTEFDISLNKITGTLPTSPGFNENSKLKVFNVSFCALSGRIPYDFMNSSFENPSVETHYLDLRNNYFEGELPNFLVDELEINVAENMFQPLTEVHCNNLNWNSGNVEQFGCDGIACSVGTSNEIGRQISDYTPCVPCEYASHIGTVGCVDVLVPRPSPPPSHNIFDEECDLKCFNGGVCEIGIQDLCLCPMGYFGKQCELGYEPTPPPSFVNTYTPAPFSPSSFSTLPENLYSEECGFYATDGFGRLYTFYPFCGGGGGYADLGGEILDIAIHHSTHRAIASRRFYDEYELLEFDLGTGKIIHSFTTKYRVDAIEFTNANLYGIVANGSWGLTTLFRINFDSSIFFEILEIGSEGIDVQIVGMAFSTADSVMYGISSCIDGGSALYQIDLNRGKAEPLCKIPDCIESIAVQYYGTIYAGTQKGCIGSINTASCEYFGCDTPFAWDSHFKNVTGLGIECPGGVSPALLPSSSPVSSQSLSERDKHTAMPSIEHSNSPSPLPDKLTSEEDDDQYDILHIFYKLLNGPAWTRNDYWLLKEISVCEWYGITCDNGNDVSEINLPSNNLDGVLEALMFARLPSLKKIDLSRNALFGEMPIILSLELESINLNNNFLEGTILREISALPKLQELMLEGNQFSYFDIMDGGYRNLRVLDLSNNYLSGPLTYASSYPIQFSVAWLESLEIISLGGNRLVGPLAPDYSRLENLATFDVSNNDLSGVLSQNPGFTKNRWLQVLNVSDNRFQGEIASDLLHASFQNPSIEGTFVLDFSKNLFEGEVPNFKVEKVDINVAGNMFKGIDDEACDNYLWNGGNVGRFGCDAIACAVGTANSKGRQTSDNNPCLPCSSAYYIGSSYCANETNPSQMASNGPSPRPTPLFYVEECTAQCYNGGDCVKGQGQSYNYQNENDNNQIQGDWCRCPSGFTGPRCEYSATFRPSPPPTTYRQEETCNAYCYNGGICTKGANGNNYNQNQNSQYQADYCRCPPGFTGFRCELILGPSPSPASNGEEKCAIECFNGGTCMKGNEYNNQIDWCFCRLGSYGSQCEFAQPTYAPTPFGTYDQGLAVDGTGPSPMPSIYSISTSSSPPKQFSLFRLPTIIMAMRSRIDQTPASDGIIKEIVTAFLLDHFRDAQVTDGSVYIANIKARRVSESDFMFEDMSSEEGDRRTQAADAFVFIKINTIVGIQEGSFEKPTADELITNTMTAVYLSRDVLLSEFQKSQNSFLKSLDVLELTSEMEVCPNGLHCHHGSKCVIEEGRFTCDCSTASIGDLDIFGGLQCEFAATSFCSSEADVYSYSYCTNGGQCARADVASGEPHPGCVCVGFYEGPHCEIMMELLSTQLVSGQESRAADEDSSSGLFFTPGSISILVIAGVGLVLTALIFIYETRKKTKRKGLYPKTLASVKDKNAVEDVAAMEAGSAKKSNVQQGINKASENQANTSKSPYQHLTPRGDTRPKEVEEEKTELLASPGDEHVSPLQVGDDTKAPKEAGDDAAERLSIDMPSNRAQDFEEEKTEIVASPDVKFEVMTNEPNDGTDASDAMVMRSPEVFMVEEDEKDEVEATSHVPQSSDSKDQIKTTNVSSSSPGVNDLDNFHSSEEDGDVLEKEEGAKSTRDSEDKL